MATVGWDGDHRDPPRRRDPGLSQFYSLNKPWGLGYTWKESRVGSPLVLDIGRFGNFDENLQLDCFLFFKFYF